MELRQLSAIVGIADHGSFSAAADALQTVQSNISAHVKKLERELGCELVDRSTGQLTEAGEIVVARSRRVQAELDAMLSDVVALTREVAGTVRIGIIGTTARWLVPQLLRAAPPAIPPPAPGLRRDPTTTRSTPSSPRDRSTSPCSTFRPRAPISP